jgi:hypothetical protein
MASKKLEQEAATILGEPSSASDLVSPHQAASAFLKKAFANVIVDQFLGTVLPQGVVPDVIQAVTGLEKAKDKLTDRAISEAEKAALERGVYGLVLIAVSTKFAIFASKAKAFGYRLGPLLVQVPKQAVVRFESGKGSLASTAGVIIELENGEIYPIETARLMLGDCRKIAEALGKLVWPPLILGRSRPSMLLTHKDEAKRPPTTAHYASRHRARRG